MADFACDIEFDCNKFSEKELNKILDELTVTKTTYVSYFKSKSKNVWEVEVYRENVKNEVPWINKIQKVISKYKGIKSASVRKLDLDIDPYDDFYYCQDDINGLWIPTRSLTTA